MQLNRIDDPRDPLSKATRGELRRFAKSIGHYNFVYSGMNWTAESAPATITRAFLRSIGQTRIKIPNRPLGSQVQNGLPATPAMASQNGVEADALADLARQYQQQRQPPAPLAPTAMGINELRAECKRLGIKLSRRDNMNSMREKIEAHAKDTFERDQ